MTFCSLKARTGASSFAAKCARTREGPQAEHVVDGIVEIEDGVLAGTIPADAASVLISSKQWRASKLAPKKYGDKLDINHSGAVGIKIGQEYEGL
jgi:hypothetical protein